MKETSLTDILNEADPTKQSIALNNVTVTLLKQNQRNQVIQWIALGVMFLLFMGMFLFMSHDNARMRQEVVSVVTNYQKDFLDFMASYEYVVEDTTTTQEVSGDDANIVNGNQYRENATHNQGGESEWATQDKPSQDEQSQSSQEPSK